MNNIVLSARMQMVADMVTRGNIAADIGCDHGFVSIYLLEQGICPKVIAMDVNCGPLLRAKEHVKERGLAEYIDVRLSDGIDQLAAREADSILIAGMGGRLIMKILADNMKKAKLLKEVILQPQSELQMVRQFLIENGFHIIAEDMVKDAGKYYPVIKAVWKETEPEELTSEQLWFGKLLLKNRHPVLYEYLLKEKAKFKQIQKDIADSGSRLQSDDKKDEEWAGKAEESLEEAIQNRKTEDSRLAGIQNRLCLIDKALAYYNSREEQI